MNPFDYLWKTFPLSLSIGKLVCLLTNPGNGENVQNERIFGNNQEGRLEITKQERTEIYRCFTADYIMRSDVSESVNRNRRIVPYLTGNGAGLFIIWN